MNSKQLDEETLQYLISLLRRFTQVVEGGVVRYNDFGEYDSIIDLITDGLYEGNESFIKLFSKKRFSREYLIKKISQQLPIILSQPIHINYLNQYLRNPLKEFLNQRHPEKTTYVIFPLNLDFTRINNFENEITYKQNKIQILNYSQFLESKYYHEDVLGELKERSNSSKFMHTHYSFFILKHKGSDVRFSIDYCCDVFKEILALINLSKNIRRYTQHFGNKLYALSPIKYPPVIFQYNNRRRYENYLYSDNLPFEKYLWCDENHYNNLKHFFNLIFNLPNKSELNGLIFKNLILYNEGITEINVSESCHKFWNSIESVTKINNKGRVPERANSILKKPSKKWVFKLEILREKRNAYAHESKSEFVQSDRLFLKKVSEQMFIFLLNHITLLRTQADLELLYFAASKNKADLKNKLDLTKRELKLIKYVFRERGDRLPLWVQAIR